MNYGKTSHRSGIWHQLREEEDANPPSYCGLGMLSKQQWVITADAVPGNELLCLRCQNAGRWL